ncbi:MAG: extracellular solute-binding protein [Corallococcus sp.]|nr:extracellular solute-binding protein [Corallococcus sp.]MCM1359620.1 extracellular solute-binding protein [Corallococcus sp.]MCM1395212.1 extracellular solute-binding protein [Corallococcus sp.]
MKKLIALVLTLALVVSLGAIFAGCGNNLSEFEVPANGYDGSKVTIKFYHIMGQEYRTTLDNHIKEFNKLYPNITVDQKAIGGYDDVRNQIKTELTGDDYPNMAYCYPDHVALYNQTKKVVALDSLIDSTIEITDALGNKSPLGFTQAQKDDFVETFWEEGKQFEDGKMYTLPFAKSTEVLYFNRDFFEAHASDGLQVPDHWFASDGKEGLASSDTTSVEYVCAKLKELDSSCTPFGYDSESNWFITLCQQAGISYTALKGNHYQFNTPDAQKLMKTLRRWYNSGYFTTGTLYNSGSTSGYTSNLFKGNNASTRSYMTIGSSAGAGNQCPDKDANTGTYPFEVGITTIPQMDVDNATAISQGPNVCLFNRSNPQEVVASWLFLKYLLTSHAFQFEFTNIGGYVPPIKSLSDPTLADEIPAVKLYIKNMEQANGTDRISYLSQKVCLGLAEGNNYKSFFTSPAFPGSSTARDQVGQLLVACISNKGTDADSIIRTAFVNAINECEYSG